MIAPDELRADSAYYTHSAEGAAAQVKESEAALRLQEQQTTEQIRQAEATLAVGRGAAGGGRRGRRERAARCSSATKQLLPQGIVSVEEFDQARTAYEAAKARARLAEASRWTRSAAALGAGALQRRADRHEAQPLGLEPAAAGRRRRAAHQSRRAPRLHRDPRADRRHRRRARRAQGEVVSAGQPMLTLINPDDLWVRADVEETYIDRIRVGDTPDRPPAVRRGARRARSSTAASTPASPRSATSAAPSATSRRSRCACASTTSDRRLAVGMTAYVHLASALADAGHRRPPDRQALRRLHRGGRHQLHGRGGRDLRPARARTAPASRRSSAC